MDLKAEFFNIDEIDEISIYCDIKTLLKKIYLRVDTNLHLLDELMAEIDQGLLPLGYQGSIAWDFTIITD